MNFLGLPRAFFCIFFVWSMMIRYQSIPVNISCIFMAKIVIRYKVRAFMIVPFRWVAFVHFPLYWWDFYHTFYEFIWVVPRAAVSVSCSCRAPCSLVIISIMQIVFLRIKFGDMFDWFFWNKKGQNQLFVILWNYYQNLHFHSETKHDQ